MKKDGTLLTKVNSAVGPKKKIVPNLDLDALLLATEIPTGGTIESSSTSIWRADKHQNGSRDFVGQSLHYTID